MYKQTFLNEISQLGIKSKHSMRQCLIIHEPL